MSRDEHDPFAGIADPPAEKLPDPLIGSRLDQRRTAQHPTGGRKLTIAGVTFDPRLPYELALGLDSAEVVFTRYGIDAVQAAKLLGHEVFKVVLGNAAREVKEAGLTFKMRARLMAEDLLEEGYLIATDAEAPANVRADLIKWTAKMGDLEPAPKDKAVGVGGPLGGGFNLSITLVGGGEAAGGRVIEVQAEPSNAPAEPFTLKIPQVPK